MDGVWVATAATIMLVEATRRNGQLEQMPITIRRGEDYSVYRHRSSMLALTDASG